MYGNVYHYFSNIIISNIIYYFIVIRIIIGGGDLFLLVDVQRFIFLSTLSTFSAN